MRRLTPLLLLAVSSLCWAGPEDDAPKKAACVYARPVATANAGEADAPQARPATPSAARTTAPKPAAGGSGGGEADAVLPRGRGNRWHSFLPGMFR
ncbi:hypothetical protein [Pseudoxanthomonas koreensis]|uniref:hypothetical protein n=1 Tax=Pseudoxanthomonas koreensis TaxID=266061 RepID=UPI0013918288|nr:hypothetical protein [Pseudoxanthomonas koreensis]KAF1694613.1 hypothetical protein CSC64_04170 [Pseudoxanthomonas koreensis]